MNLAQLKISTVPVKFKLFSKKILKYIKNIKNIIVFFTSIIFTNKAKRLLDENMSLKTKLHKQQIENSELKKVLCKQSKEASLGQMIHIISHQWKQPLTELNMNNLFLIETTKKIQKKEILHDNENIIHFLSDTITVFENYYKNTEITKFAILHTIQDSIRILKTSFKKFHIQTNILGDAELTLYGKTNLFTQVVFTILQNSYEIIKDRKVKNPSIVVSLEETEKYTLIEVYDNAGGIREDYIDEIFKPHKSFKSNPTSGMGLYFAKNIIQEKFYGELTVSNYENGAKFTIKIPLSKKTEFKREKLNVA